MASASPVRLSVDVEVRYAETDQMGHVHHGVHVVWFELARTRLCQESGFAYRDIEAMGYFLLVTGVEVRYLKPALYGSDVQVECWLEHYASRKLRFGYTIHQDGAAVATGTTEHMWFDRAKERPCRTPKVLEAPFRQLAQGEIPGSTPEASPGP